MKNSALFFLFIAFFIQTCGLKTESDGDCEEYLALVECDDFPPAYKIEEQIMTEVISGKESCFSSFVGIEGDILLHVYINQIGELSKWEMSRDLDQQCMEEIENSLKSVTWAKASCEDNPACYYVILPIRPEAEASDPS